MNVFDSKLQTSIVSSLTQDMRNWLDENKVEHYFTPNLVRIKHVLVPRKSIMIKDSGRDKQFDTRGTKIIFDDAKERLHFELMFSEYITG